MLKSNICSGGMGRSTLGRGSSPVASIKKETRGRVAVVKIFFKKVKKF
jgi:hypothetical protein